MIPHNSLSEEKKLAKSNAERKQKQREKERLQKSGLYIKPLLDQAKEELLTIKNYDIDLLLQNEKYQATFDNNQIKQLYHFRSYNIQKLRKQHLEQSSSEKSQQNNIEKVQRLANLQIPQLHQSLLIPQTTTERRALIKSKIEENLFLFLEYMEKYQTPTSDFLEIIIELCLELQEETSTKLFVRVCFMHKGENLIITKDMTEKGMKYLVENKIDNIASHGLLRLAFLNDISFATLPIQLLLEFQNEYQQTILSFFKSIPMLPLQLVESLPATCFCLTTPMISALKDQGRILHTQVPPQFLPFFIEILCFSFTDSTEEFENFVKVFKEGCMKLYEALLQKQFQALLQAVSEQAQQMNKQFFKKLTYQTIILQRSFELIQEKKILVFDMSNINQLMEYNNEGYQILKQRPKIIKESSLSSLNQLLNYIKNQNVKINTSDLKDNFSLSSEEQKIFQQMNISSLLLIQQICYKFCIMTRNCKSQFIQYDTGQGKTSICLGLSVQFSQTYPHVLILNKSKYLTFRDFKKANSIMENLQRRVVIACEQNFDKIWEFNIIFLTFENYEKLCKTEFCENIKSSCLIVDEYDSILFEPDNENQNIQQLLSIPSKILALTGSKLLNFHKTFIKMAFETENIDFTLPQTYKNEQVLKNIKLTNLLKQFEKEVVKLCIQQVQKTPVIIIIEQSQFKVKDQLEKKGISVEYLIDKAEQYIESALISFNQRINNKYSVFIVNSQLGRGLDFLSSHDIEQNGGVYLIISSLPQYYLQFQQFIGRTGRVGGKGQYSIIIFDKNSKNQDPEIYLNKKLNELQNLELTKISNKNSSKRQNQISNSDIQFQQQEEEKKEEFSNEKNENFIEQSQENVECRKLTDVLNQLAEKTMLFEDQLQVKMNNSNKTKKSLVNIENVGQKRNNKRNEKHSEKINQRFSKRIMGKFSNIAYIDEQYFKSYEDPLIHKEMLDDEIRLQAYDQALSKVSQDKIAIDVGAGTAVLSMMAVRYGAQKVYAIEYSQIFKQAQKNIIDNNFGNKIVLINDKAEDFYMEDLKVDIIVSEWMGYFMIFENMLPSVLAIRDKYLKNDGIIIPNRGQLFISAFKNSVDLKGINICLQESKSIQEPLIEIIQENKIITDSAIILDIDLKNEDFLSNIFENSFELTCLKTSSISGFVVWFDVTLIDDIKLSTSPFSPSTHWKQVLLILKNSVEIQENQKLQAKIKVTPLKENHRGININLSYKTEKMKNFSSQQWNLQ